ncbi:MAG: hypothetical protein JWM57_3964 [Phycisphaerales bacterium]|nr:hypothetical protein [Phycisphaerales bacterium]
MVKPIRLAAAVWCAALVVSSGIGAGAAPSSPPTFEGVSDTDLQALAKKGDTDAAFAMGERLISTDKKAAFTYYSMAAKAEHIGALKVLLEANHKPDGKPIDKSQEVALLKRLAAAGSIEHHALLRDLSPDNYWSVARVTGPKTDVADPTLTSRPQRFTARVNATQEDKPKKKKSKKDKATVEAPKAESSGTVDRVSSAGQTLATVKVDFSDAKDFKPVGGRQVEIAGYNDSENVFHAIMVHQPDPVFKYDGELLKHGVVAGKEQNWEVKVTVRNTGVQMIKKIELKVRCFQRQSPNDNSTPVTFNNIAPGDTVTSTASFSVYNFQYIGKSSVPSVEVKVDKYDW